MNFNLLIDSAEIQNPDWANKVERWYQLDQASLIVCEAVYRFTHEKNIDLTKTDLIIFSVLKSSNYADYDFVYTGAMSPSKFVYTLASIPASVVQQMLGISTPTYCIGYLADIDLVRFQKLLKKKYRNILTIVLQPPSVDCQYWVVQGSYNVS